MRLFNFSLILLFITACNSPRAVYDYDQEVNFSAYSSYALFPEFRTGLSQLDEARLVESLKTGMQKEGLSLTGEPAIYVNVYTEMMEKDNRSRLGVGIGGGGGNVGVGVSGGIPVGAMDTYLKLTFDFIDVQRDELVWQAVVESPFNFNAEPQKRQERFTKIVQEVLEGYPPGD